MKCFVLKDAHSLWYWKEKEIENCWNECFICASRSGCYGGYGS
jgi:hypothetical protein